MREDRVGPATWFVGFDIKGVEPGRSVSGNIYEGKKET